MPANFAPNLHYAKGGIGDFRFWCQKTLPAVYDDSLSYYELLCKVMKYLSDAADDIGELGDAYLELQDYVNNFFDSVNIPSEIADRMFAYVFNNPDRTPNVIATIPTEGVQSNIYSELIRKYDALPLSRHSWGVDEDNNPLYWYTWTPLTYNRTNLAGQPAVNRAQALYDGNQMSCTIMCSTGIHGNERQSVISLYNTIAWILTADDNLARYVRDNFKIVVAPCVNPWGYINDNRYAKYDVSDASARKTDINRNFPPYWSSYDSATKGTEPYSTSGARYLRDFLAQIPEDNRYTTSYFDFHDFTGRDGTYANYNLMCSSSLPDAKVKALPVLSWIIEFLDKAGYSNLFKSTRNINFTDISKAPLGVQYAWQSGFRNCFLFENRLDLEKASQKYDAISAKVSALLISLCLTTIAPRISFERTPTTVRRLADIGMAPAENGLADIIDAMPRGATLGYYVAATLTDSSPLGQDLPTDRPGLLEINKLYAGNYSAIMHYTATDTLSNPEAWVCYRLYGGQISPWYKYALETS